MEWISRSGQHASDPARGLLAGRIIRSAAALSAGTLVVQASALLTQVLFAVWLSPADFGYWAAATSLVAVASGLVNLGEVNGFLANPLYSYVQARRSVWRINSVLALVGLCIGLFAWRTTNTQTALLVTILALNLPLLGYSSLLVAAFIRARRPRQVVLAQIAATVARILIGVLLVAVFNSALAFGISTVLFCAWLSMHLGYRLKGNEFLEREIEYVVTRRSKTKWAAYSLAQYMPGQVDYLVLTFATDAPTLGIYFMAFQMTVGLSGLVAGPLSKTVLSGLSSEAEAEQNEGFWSVTRVTVGIVIVAAAMSAAACLLISPIVPAPWSQVPGVAAVLLASLPARFLAPLTDARLMASDRWSAGTLLCTLDALGTAVAACSIAVLDLEGLAMTIVAWKVLFGGVRLWVVSCDGWRRWCSIMLPLAASTICIVAAKIWIYGFYVPLGLAVVLGLMMLTFVKAKVSFVQLLSRYRGM